MLNYKHYIEYYLLQGGGNRLLRCTYGIKVF